MKMEQNPLCKKTYWHLRLNALGQECGNPPLELPAQPVESFLISAWRPNICHPIPTSAFGPLWWVLFSQTVGVVTIGWGKDEMA
ncbi:hypothetical protein LZ32DRAFT_336215 [Colletotrichum eremochloae]|nr:hypothetical protein LZ32DRAFT_336215 [Colletotrichum eremochloae]